MGCCFPHGELYIQVGDEAYMHSITYTKSWYDGVFVSSFAQLAAHYAHRTKDMRANSPTPFKLPLLMHVTYPKQTLAQDQCKALPPEYTDVVALIHEGDHYAVLEIDTTNKKVLVFDGLYRELTRWLEYVYSSMKRCKLCALDVVPLSHPDPPTQVKRAWDRNPKVSIEGITLMIGSSPWRYERGHFLMQTDTFNCGSIACMTLLAMFGMPMPDEVRVAYDSNGLRSLVAEYWKHFLRRCEADIVVQVRERLPLWTPIAEEGNIVLPSRNKLSTAPVRNTSIALAVAASAEAEIDHHQFCFCYCDAPGTDLLQMQCCKQTIHRHCLVAHLSVNSQCPYCCEPIEDIATVLELPTVNRSDILCEKMPAKRPTNPFLKMLDRSDVTRGLQSMMLDRTPLRQADTVRADSQERKRQAQLIQAKKMMKMQGQDIASKGAAPGVVVTVQCDYRAVSHCHRPWLYGGKHSLLKAAIR
jgi:hypothetical protein